MTHNITSLLVDITYLAWCASFFCIVLAKRTAIEQSLDRVRHVDIYSNQRHNSSSRNILIIPWWLAAGQVINPSPFLLADGTN